MELPQAVLIGHSFIRRFRDTLITVHHPETATFRGRKPRRKSGRDISESRIYLARQAVNNVPLAHRLSRLHTASDGINLVEELWKADSTVTNVSPAIVLLDIGSNDIAHVVNKNANNMLQLASNVIDYANTLRSKHSVAKVIINSVVPRDSDNMTCTAKIFRDNMQLYNNFVKQWCETSDGLQYNHLRGFYTKYVQGLEVPLPVHEWTIQDHIHCNDMYMQKYKQRVRFAIMEATAQLHS